MEAQQTTTTTSSDDLLFRVLGWAHERRKPLIIGVAVVAVAGIAYGLYSWKQGEDEHDANVKLLEQPVAQDLRVHGAGNALQDIARQYPATPAGEFAAILAAENLFVSGDYAGAQNAFTAFQNDRPGSSLAAQAGLGVAASLEAQGKIPEAIQQYQRVVQANPTELAVVAPAKLTLGRLNEEQKKFDIAFSQYRELAQNPNPNDLYAQEARERLQILVTQHPELMKQMITAPSLQNTPAKTLTPAPAPAVKPATGSNSPNLLQIPAPAKK